MTRSGTCFLGHPVCYTFRLPEHWKHGEKFIFRLFLPPKCFLSWNPRATGYWENVNGSRLSPTDCVNGSRLWTAKGVNESRSRPVRCVNGSLQLCTLIAQLPVVSNALFSGTQSGAIDASDGPWSGLIDAFGSPQSGAIDTVGGTQSGAIDVFSGTCSTRIST